MIFMELEIREELDNEIKICTDDLYSNYKVYDISETEIIEICKEDLIKKVDKWLDSDIKYRGQDLDYYNEKMNADYFYEIIVQIEEIRLLCK